MNKKKVFDKVMLINRLKEEELIVVQEIKQHCEYIGRQMETIKELSARQCEYYRPFKVCVIWNVQNSRMEAKVS